MKKLFSIMLIFTFISSCVFTLSSCTGNDAGNGTSADTVFDTAPELDTSTVEVIKNGEAMYSVVYPENCSDVLSSAVDDFVSKIQTSTGSSIICIKDSQATQENGKYILIGQTCFAQSSASLDSLSKNSDAYTIEKANEHIVIAGHYDSAIISALSYFIDTLMPKNYDTNTKTLTLEEWCFDGSDAIPASFISKDIKKYTIVYSSTEGGYEEIAKGLHDRIKTSKGVEIPVVKDTEAPEAPHEILIGKTNRYLSSKCYESGTYLMEYKMVVEKGQLQIVCGGLYSARSAVNKLVSTVIKNDNELATGTHLQGDLAKESVSPTKGTDVRIMSVNVLDERAITQHSRFPASVQRAEILAKILVDYTPDIIGVQEMDRNYHEPLQSYFKIIKDTYGIKYSMILEKSDGKINSSPIIYRSDKFKLDYQKFTVVPYLIGMQSDEYSNGISSAKFTSIQDPTLEVALLSTHWHWEKEGVSDTPKQYHDATCMANEFKYLEATYPNAHIFCTGDFNSHRFQNKYLNQLIDDINGEISSSIAIDKGVFQTSFMHQGQLIDHIIGKKGTFDVLLHAPAKNKSENLTDHQPIFADICFE